MKKIISITIALVLLISTSAFALDTDDFDRYMEDGIYYFERGMYYEAKEYFQEFKRSYYSELNSGQKNYFNDWYDGTLKQIEKIEKQGMQKGISYYNQGKYTEAQDEFLWFYQLNGHRFSSEQETYWYNYYNKAIETGESDEVETYARNMVSLYGKTYYDAIKYLKTSYQDNDVKHNATVNKVIVELCEKRYKNIGCPIDIGDVSLVVNDEGKLVGVFDVVNVGGKKVTDVSVKFICFGENGKPVSGNIKDTVTASFKNADLLNGDLAEFNIVFDNDTGIASLRNLKVSYVKFEDGTVWFR